MCIRDRIKEELVEYGYIKRKRTDKKAKIKSKPFHYISSDGYHMYVGKNNYQNEELTFKFATGNDWWFHAKGMPGSHVVVKTNNETDLPDRMFEEAGKLAGYYSSGRDSDKIEIDYLQKKNVKKPNGSAPGFVVYYTNFSLTVHPDISGLTPVSYTHLVSHRYHTWFRYHRYVRLRRLDQNGSYIYLPLHWLSS